MKEKAIGMSSACYKVASTFYDSIPVYSENVIIMIL